MAEDSTAPDHVAPVRFADRTEAGGYLAAELGHHAAAGTVVLGLLHGGVPVAAEIGRHLGTGFDALAATRLVLPERSTVAYAALAAYGDDVALRYVAKVWAPARQHFAAGVLDAVEAAARRELADLQQRLLGGGPPPVDGRTVVLCEDGTGTGAALLAAIEVVRRAGAARVVVALPVASPAARQLLEPEADEFLCAIKPKVFNTVGAFYSRFDAVGDGDVAGLLGRS